MTRIRVATIVGTRPELIKLSRVIAELRSTTDHVLVHTGQNYDPRLSKIFFDDLGIAPPEHWLDAHGASAAETIAQVIAKTDAVLAKEKPEALLLLGDTNSCLAVIPAKRRRIPVFHMEAGNRCFDERVPEEINRRIVDHTSDVNLPYTEHARRYLLAEGLRPETVIKTGSPMGEVLHHYRDRIQASRILDELKLAAGGYFIVSAHREETVDDPARLARLVDLLGRLASRFGKEVVVSTHPRTRQRLDAQSLPVPARVRFVPPFAFTDYVRLQQSAFCVVSDSGTLTEEASLLGAPGVMIREAHERPEGMDEGTVIMAGLSVERAVQAVELATAHAKAGWRPAVVEDYAPLDVSKKVVRIILGYVDYVNRTVWRA